MEPVSKTNAPHYQWGEICSGWRLADTASLRVIHEHVPPGGKETRHYHQSAEQFFFVLSGTVTIVTDENTLTLAPGQGAHIPPNTVHQMLNKHDKPCEFLVISAPSTHTDRVDLTH